MSDLEARREARRRKILQSTDDRMNKVLGRQYDTPTETENANKEDISEGPTADHLEQSPVLRQRTNATITNNVNESTTVDSTTTRTTVKVSPLRRPQTLNNQTDQNESLNSSRSSSEAKMMLKHFEFLRIALCFMTAFLCRKVLVSGYGMFYVQSVMLPFMCLEAGFFVFKRRCYIM